MVVTKVGVTLPNGFYLADLRCQMIVMQGVIRRMMSLMVFGHWDICPLLSRSVAPSGSLAGIARVLSNP